MSSAVIVQNLRSQKVLMWFIVSNLWSKNNIAICVLITMKKIAVVCSRVNVNLKKNKKSKITRCVIALKTSINY